MPGVIFCFWLDLLAQVSNFEVFDQMGKDDNHALKSAPLDNIVNMQTCKSGAQITFGVPAEIMHGIAAGRLVGAFIVADKDEFAATKARMEEA